MDEVNPVGKKKNKNTKHAHAYISAQIHLIDISVLNDEQWKPCPNGDLVSGAYHTPAAEIVYRCHRIGPGWGCGVVVSPAPLSDGDMPDFSNAWHVGGSGSDSN